jgi:hypothetical protein
MEYFNTWRQSGVVCGGLAVLDVIARAARERAGGRIFEA